MARSGAIGNFLNLAQMAALVGQQALRGSRINTGYAELQDLFMKNLPSNYKVFNEYHALIVKLAKEYCKNDPLCNKCPISRQCDYGKPKLNI